MCPEIASKQILAMELAFWILYRTEREFWQGNEQAFDVLQFSKVLILTNLFAISINFSS